MESKKILLLSATAILTLAGCNGLKKVEFSEFKSAVEEAVKFEDFKKKPEQTRINGLIKSEGKEYTVKNLKVSDDTDSMDIKDWTLEEVTFFISYKIFASTIQVTSFAVTESEELTYYVWNGFKVKGETDEGSVVASWDKYCNLTKLEVESKETSCNFTVSYKY